MIEEIVLALGLVAVIEGIVLAVAPKRLEDALRAITSMSPETRRYIGLAVTAFGVLLVWVARNFLS